MRRLALLIALAACGGAPKHTDGKTGRTKTAKLDRSTEGGEGVRVRDARDAGRRPRGVGDRTDPAQGRARRDRTCGRRGTTSA